MAERIISFLENLKERQLVLSLLGIAFGLRLYAVLMAKGIAIDSAVYGFMARDFLKGDFIKGLSPTLHPLYPALISLIAPDATHVEIAGRFISLFWGTFTLIPLYYLVKGAMGQKDAVFTALFYTFHPYLVTYSGMLLTEATYWGLLVLSVYFFWTGLKEEKVWRIALSGSLLGLAYLTRPEGIGYILVYLGWIVANGVLKKKWFKKLVFMGVLIPSVFVFVVPYVIYIHQETGQWLISKKVVAIIIPQFLKKSVAESNFSKGVEQEKTGENNIKVLMITQNMVNYFPSVIYYYLSAYHFSLWLFLFFGLIRVRQKVIPYELFIASLVLFHLFSLSTFTPSTLRFAVPLVPLSLLWAGSGVFEIKRRLERFSIVKPEKGVGWMLILVLLMQLPQSFTPERVHRAHQKAIGHWLMKNTPDHAIIMSNSPIETFYAEREFIPLPQGIPAAGNPGTSYGEIIRYARQWAVRFILVNQDTPVTNPDFIPSIKKSDLKEFYRYQEGGKKFTIVYEVVS